jgi:alkaline phosphatase D
MGIRRSVLSRRQLGAAASVSAMLAACGSDDGDPGGTGGSGGAGGGGQTGPGAEPPVPWEPGGSVDEVAFMAGTRVADASATSAIAGTRTSEPSVTLHVAKGSAEGWEELAPIDAITPLDGVAEVELGGLEADHSYAVAFFSSDGLRRSSVTRFRSAPDASASRIIRFGASSCFGGNLPWATLGHAALDKLDFFMLLGDTIYADSGANAFDFEGKWQIANDVAGMRDLAASTSLIATWDDHEVDNNWSWLTPGIDADVDAALLAFRRGMPHRRGGGALQIWRKLSWGAALDVFVLEGRGERIDGNYISAEQMTWLKDELSSSSARFKLIMNSVPIIDFTGTPVGDIQAADRWQGFPAQRSEIVSHIAGIEGVLWISGDFHVGGVAYIDPAGGPGAAVPEVLTGPGGSAINPGAGLLQPNERIASIVGMHNATLFEADPETGNVRTTFVADDGSVIDELTLQL